MPTSVARVAVRKEVRLRQDLAAVGLGPAASQRRYSRRMEVHVRRACDSDSCLFNPRSDDQFTV